VKDAILVLNAGSSSIKFLLFVEGDRALDPVVRGQIEGIQTAPRFVARGPDGGLLAETPGRRLDLSLDALADLAVDALGAEASRLWEP
jgi:acetate kinase